MPRRSAIASVSPISPGLFYEADDLAVVEDCKAFILDDSFPCVGAKAALAQDAITFRVYRTGDRAADPKSSATLYFDIVEYLLALDLDTPVVKSFAAVFPDARPTDELDFEARLFDRLETIAKLDMAFGVDWHAKVSDDPENPHFSFSVAGHPFFVVGLHPEASRAARRAPVPMMIFNSNIQFDQLREDGRYDALKAVIRKRDMKVSGSINPMLDDHGDAPETRQYSGRKLPDSWTCPVDFAALRKGETA